MIHMLIGGAGCGKSDRMIQLAKQYVSDGEHVLTLVPEQFSYEFDQKLYRNLGPVLFNQLETYTFTKLADGVFRRCGKIPDGKTNADSLTKTALLYQAVLYVSERDHALQFFEKQCRQPAFLDELAVLFSQFRRNGITSDYLYDCTANLSGRLCDKTRDLFSIFYKYNQLLEQHQLKDTETELTEAAMIANGQDAFLGDVLFVDEFDTFTEDEYEMLSVLFSSCKDVVVALRTDGADPRPFSLFETVCETFYRIKRMAADLHIPVSVDSCNMPYRFQAPELQWLSQHIFQETAPFSGSADHLHIMEASTPNEEVDYVCATIRRLLVSHPELRCQDIAVLTNQLTEYQSILETAMDRYELPYHMDQKQSMQFTPLLVYLNTLLALLPRKYPDTELLLRLGKTGLTDCTAAEIANLENYCYAWQIEGKTWETPFCGGDFAAVEVVREKLLLPLQTLQKQLLAIGSGGAYCQLLYEFLVQQQIEMRLHQQILAISDAKKQMQTREEWAFVWNSVMEILEHLARLYQDVPLDFSEFCTVLSAMIRGIQLAVPPRTLDAILISQGSTARLNAPKVVFLLGVCDGTFPERPGNSAFFSERDCLALEKLRIPVAKPKEGQLADARLSAYKLLSAASHALYLTYPNADITQQKCYPSSVIAQILRMFPKADSLKQTCAEQGSAYYACTLHAAYYQLVQNYTVQSAETASIFKLLSEDPFYAKRLQDLTALTAAQSRQADVPLFQIAQPRLIEQCLGKTLYLSASALERYQQCPFQYFCQDILRLYRRQRIHVTGAGSGNLIHFCLEQFFRNYDREQFISLTSQELQRETAAYGAIYWQAEMGGNFSKSSREIAVYQHTIADMLPLLQHLQREFQQSAFFPYRVELQLTPEDPEFPALQLKTAHGQRIYLIGKVDRVDLCQECGRQWVRVIDYKSGSKSFSLGNLLYGMDMQMLTYLFSITSEQSILSASQPAGVLYLPSGKVKSDLQRGCGVTPEMQQNDTYRMNGVLLRDPHLITLMEREGSGVFLPGKLNANQQLEDAAGTFLTEEQMRHLRQFVLRKLTETAENIYHGEIDANPLQLQTQTPCSYCDYANICGNALQEHKRQAVGNNSSREKMMMCLLDEEPLQEKGEED